MRLLYGVLKGGTILPPGISLSAEWTEVRPGKSSSHCPGMGARKTRKWNDLVRDAGYFHTAATALVYAVWQG